MRTWTVIALAALAACGKKVEAEPVEPAPAEPAVVEPAPAAPVTMATPDVVGTVSVQPMYHATLTLTEGGKVWMFDPWSKAPLGDVKADVVLITDEHFDHLDLEALAKVKKEGTIVVGPKVIADKTAVDVVIANGETKEVAGAKVTAVAMYNLERGPEAGKKFHDAGRGNGYVLELGGKRFYVAGDTECTPEMKALTAIDVAFVPMNLPYTMPPEEATACVAAFKPAILYPFHYAGSDVSAVAVAGVDVRVRDWYPGGLPF